MPRDPRFQDGDGAQALHWNEPRSRWEGYAVESGCDVVINTGDLGSGNNTLTVQSGTVIVDGSEVSVSSQSVDIAASDTDPRKDLVVYDESNAAITVKQGTPEAAVPRDATALDTRRPAPRDLSAEDAVVLQEVWVPADAISIGSGDLFDRRLLITQPAVYAGSVYTKSRAYEFVVYEDGGTVFVEGASGEVASGSSDSAIKTAVEANPSGSFWVNTDIPVSSRIQMDLGGNSGLTFHMGGKFVPQISGLTHVCRFVNGNGADLKIQVASVDGATADYKYIQNYAGSTTGLDAALNLRGMRGFNLHLHTHQWGGRGLEIEEGASGESSTFEYRVHSLVGENLGQSFHIDSAGNSIFGEVDGVRVAEDDGAYVNAVDFTLGYYENSYNAGNNPTTFDNCGILDVEHLAVGPDCDPLVRFKDGTRLDLKHVYAFGQGNAVTGVEITSCDRVDGKIWTKRCKTRGLTLDNARDGSNITHHSENDTNSVQLTDSSGATRELDLYEYSLDADERAVDIVSPSTGLVSRSNIYGVLRSANTSGTAGESSLHADDTSHDLTLHGVVFESGNVKHHIDAPSGNSISAIGCRIKGAPNTSKIVNALEQNVAPKDFVAVNSGVESDAVALDSTGGQSITVSHGLDRTPSGGEITAHIGEQTQTDWDGFIEKIKSVGASSFEVIVTITSASGTSGASADLAWRADAQH